MFQAIYIVLTIVLKLRVCFSTQIKVYKSTVSSDDEPVLSGLVLKNDSIKNIALTDLRGVSFCARFNYMRLMGPETPLLWIKSNKSPTDWQLTYFLIGYDSSFMAFGNQDDNGDIPSWIIKEENSQEYTVWAANKWHHVCYSYSASTSRIQLIKVRTVLLTITARFNHCLGRQRNHCGL